MLGHNATDVDRTFYSYDKVREGGNTSTVGRGAVLKSSCGFQGNSGFVDMNDFRDILEDLDIPVSEEDLELLESVSLWLCDVPAWSTYVCAE